MERFAMATDKKEVKPVLKKGKVKTASQGKRRKVNFKAIGHFFKDVVSEMKKVTWPSRKEFISYSMAVLVFVVIFGVIIFGFDSVLGLLPKTIASLNGNG
jgi:preprotein translocase subunit SecE